jgi:hypothetical protein
MFQSSKGTLQHRNALSRHIVKLLRKIGVTRGPESGTDSNGHENCKGVFRYFILF